MASIIIASRHTAGNTVSRHFGAETKSNGC